jgi:predicted nucleic acid-binding protein
MIEVFLDSAYAIALAALNDQYHERAITLADKLEADAVRLITTRAVVLEIGNALSSARHRQAAISMLTGMEQDQNVEIIPLSEELYERAFQLYRNRPDKGWGLTDCVSFVVMQERGLTEALTSDAHFEQAGFRALLRQT